MPKLRCLQGSRYNHHLCRFPRFSFLWTDYLLHMSPACPVLEPFGSNCLGKARKTHVPFVRVPCPVVKGAIGWLARCLLRLAIHRDCGPDGRALRDCSLGLAGAPEGTRSPGWISIFR